MRGSAIPDLNLPSSGVIEFRAAPATHLAGSRYRMTLVRQDEAGASKPVGAAARLQLSADGYLHAYADAARLESGSYLLRIEPDAQTPGTAQVFAFTLRARGASPTP